MKLPTKSVNACVHDLRWMVGHWQGHYAEGWGEETWNDIHDNIIIGTSRCHNETGLKHTDLTWIIQDKGTVQTVFRRFDSNFRPLEHLAEPICFDLVECHLNHALFYNAGADGDAWMLYQREGDTLIGKFFFGDPKELMHSYEFTLAPLPNHTS